MNKSILIMKGLLLLLLFVQIPFACAEQPQTQTAPSKQSVSNQQIADFVRKSFNVPQQVGINIKDVNTSTINGLRQINIEISNNGQTQAQDAWITSDNHLLVGRLLDLSVDPYKKNVEKIHLENAPTTGASNAKVTIVEYSDFQCPYCGSAYKTVDLLMQQYQGKVKLVYKHLPLSIHNWAEDAAVDSACVYQQKPDAFWKVYEYLFANQTSITKETLTDKVLLATKDSGVNAEDLKKCITSRSTLPLVQANMAEAGTLGLSSTPSFIINGHPLVGAQPIEQFKQVVDDALKSAQ
jgi:protein-disulfide isomerase